MVGAQILARAVNDPNLAHSLLNVAAQRVREDAAA
jgi:hypothetical protein